VNAPAVLDLNDNSETVFSLTGDGGVALGSATLTTGNNSGDAPEFNGVISGSGGVSKVGIDGFTLSGLNTYTGATAVLGGTLTVSGALNSDGTADGGLVNLDTAGVVLNGAGTIKGRVVVNASTSANRTQVQGVTIESPRATAASASTWPRPTSSCRSAPSAASPWAASSRATSPAQASESRAVPAPSSRTARWKTRTSACS
jgi:autotransporter-associated beta strand protein